MKKEQIKWVEKISWEEFRDSGLLWWINTTLHLFGRAIVFDYEKNTGKLKEVYFAKCKYRGFDSQNIENGYKNLTKFVGKNIKELKKDVNR